MYGCIKFPSFTKIKRPFIFYIGVFGDSILRLLTDSLQIPVVSKHACQTGIYFLRCTNFFTKVVIYLIVD